MSIHCSYYCAWPNSPPAYNIPSITNQINQSERNPLISFAFHNYSPNKIDEMNGLWYSMVFQFGWCESSVLLCRKRTKIRYGI